MSCGWTYICKDEFHNGETFEADDELNHGEEALLDLLEAFELGKLPSKAQIEIGKKGEWLEIDVQLWYKSWPWRFLVEHPLCEIQVVSEYGDTAVRDDDGNIRKYRKDGTELK